jgi:FkbM family methyltransferase
MIAADINLIKVANICLRFLGRVPRIPSGPGRGLRFEGGSVTGVFLSGRYELPVQEALSEMLKPGDVFYDVGANFGFFSLLAGRLVGSDGVVYAFEPVRENAAMIERNARLNQMHNITVFEVALSDRTGRSELLLANYPGGAALKSAGPPPDFAGSLEVKTSTIDDFVGLRRGRPPDVVKIDVEGAELDVLHGMVNTLKETSGKLIIEVDDADRQRCEKKLNACRDFLGNLGYGTQVLPNCYRDGHWFVRHLVASPAFR